MTFRQVARILKRSWSTTSAAGDDSRTPTRALIYEYICRRVGIAIHYCAEQFNNDETAFAAIVKSIKRAMAAEYSRDLSARSFVGQARILRLGFRAGSSAAYGTRRLLVDQYRNAKFILQPGVYKALQTDRVVAILGPPEEIRVVRWIFKMFVNEGKSEGPIAKLLNRKGVSSGLARPWSPARVRWILRNEIYIGNSVWNRTSIKLGRKLVRNPPETWFRVRCGFGPIIDVAQFDAAQRIFLERRHRPSKEEILETLRRIYRRHGYLDSRLIEQSPELPSLNNLYKHFGGLRQVYKLVGSKSRPGTNLWLTHEELLARLRRLLRKRGRLTRVIIDKSRGLPGSGVYYARFGSLTRAYELVGYKPPATSHQSTWANTRSLTDEEVLAALRKLLRKRGHLTQKIIDKSGETPTAPTYIGRFGSLFRAYELIGFDFKATHRSQITRRYSDDRLLDFLRVLIAQHGEVNQTMLRRTDGVPSPDTYRKRFGSLGRAYDLIGYKPKKTGGWIMEGDKAVRVRRV
jgi:Recombinase